MKEILLSALLIPLAATAAFATQKEIDTTQSTLTIHVGKTGLFSAAGHEHTVSAPIADGTIEDGATPRVTFHVRSALLMVLPEDHQSEVQHTMQTQVLDSDRFPDIQFTSDQVQPTAANQWEIAGHLNLHGQSKPIHLHVQSIDGKYIGTAIIKQSDFGIEPVSAGGGTVKVKDELKIDFSIKAK